MTSIPLPAVEFAAFMALAVWLFFWQRKNSRRDAPSSEARQRPDGDPQG